MTVGMQHSAIGMQYCTTSGMARATGVLMQDDPLITRLLYRAIGRLLNVSGKRQHTLAAGRLDEADFCMQTRTDRTQHTC